MWRLSEAAERIRERQRAKINAELKAKGAEPVNEYELDMIVFKRIPFGHSVRHEFFLRCGWHQWGNDFMLEAEGVENYWAIRMAKAFCREKRVNLMGCGSSGKTALASAYVYTAWKSRPFNTSVFLSTTSGEAAQARTWGQVKDWHANDKYRFGKRIESLHLITLDEETTDDEGNKSRDFRNSIKVVLIKPGSEGKNVMASIVGRKNDAVIWCAQPLDEPVLTPTGWSSIGDLKIGSKIIGSDGKPTSVTHLHPVSTKQVYELEFTDGSRCRSTEDHIWTLQDSMNANPVHTAPLSYFINRIYPTGKSTPRWSLPDCPVVEFDPINLPLDPYLLGCLLGDGQIKKNATFWCIEDRDIIPHVSAALPEGHELILYREEMGQYHIRGHCGPNKRRENLVIRELKKLGLLGRGSDDKFIPEIYLRGSVEQRLHLLQGLLDTDGCVLHSTIRFTSISKPLRRGITELVRSLGGYARESYPYTVVIRIEHMQVFRAIRKLARIRPGRYKTRRKAIVSVTPVGDHDVRCITVEAKDGLYMSSNYVLTHNCDEFPFMDIGILNARVNLNTNPFSQFIGLGNAPEEGDPMYLDAAPFGEEFPDGWRSVDKNLHKSWPTEKGRCFYFNGDDSPNFKTKSGMGFPKLMNERFRLEILKDSGGEDTPMYYKQYYGFPPTVDVPDKIITHKLLESNLCYENPLWLDAQQKVGAGLDLGFREGGDPCVLDFFRLGKNVTGRTVACFERDGVVLNPSQGSKDAFETQIAKKVIQECRSRDCHDLSLDVTGDGGMILQAIEREAREQRYQLDVFPVSFSGTAEDRVVIPGDKRKGNEMFANMVSQLWATFRISCLNKVISGCHPHSKAVTQLCSRKFVTDDRKRFLVEKKSDMKKRLKRSPDHADARCVAHHLALKMGLSGMEAVAAPPERRKAEERPVAPPRYSGHASSALYGRR